MLVIESSRFASVRSIFQIFHVDSHFQIYIQGSVSSTQIFHWRGFKFYYFIAVTGKSSVMEKQPWLVTNTLTNLRQRIAQKTISDTVANNIYLTLTLDSLSQIFRKLSVINLSKKHKIYGFVISCSTISQRVLNIKFVVGELVTKMSSHERKTAKTLVIEQQNLTDCLWYS